MRRFFLNFFKIRLDTLIVGFGISGVSIAHQLRRNNTPFHVIDSSENSSSLIAGGVMNPTVLKYYTMAWEGKKFSDYAIPFYKEISNIIEYNVFENFKINRIFNSLREHNEWIVGADKNTLGFFLNKDIHLNPLSEINTPYGYGSLKNVGRLDFKNIINKYKLLFGTNYRREVFKYSKLQFIKEGVKYKNDLYKKIIFCEGYGMKENPFFNYLPLIGNKGEMLIIKAPNLSQNIIWKGRFFIVPLGQSRFWIGATFNDSDKTTNISPTAKNDLLLELEEKLNIPFEIECHDAQIRPTVIDQRPLLGSHPEFKNLYIFNGLGTRGSLMAPHLSKFLYDYIFLNKALPTSIDIRRFTLEKKEI